MSKKCTVLAHCSSFSYHYYILYYLFNWKIVWMMRLFIHILIIRCIDVYLKTSGIVTHTHRDVVWRFIHSTESDFHTSHLSLTAFIRGKQFRKKCSLWGFDSLPMCQWVRLTWPVFKCLQNNHSAHMKNRQGSLLCSTWEIREGAIIQLHTVLYDSHIEHSSKVTGTSYNRRASILPTQRKPSVVSLSVVSF